ncbi:S-(hydroxymethyl)glutathione synthase [Rhizobium hainanense]|uniref:S-(Hydroxymethyl)glutathione synthase n=1 Tax=Rhizobium hainanense TaxID=52131 RepID=A0A1C3W8X4_9HYPH|nr:S-(hydroxymethyl)glutathione synthase [Rhizobium hainanense]
MLVLETEITIDAPPQLVWSVLDDLNHYSEWNEVLPELKGRTTVGEPVKGILRQGAPVPDIPIAPTILRIVGARELRWLSQAPDPKAFYAEHYFFLQPLDGGRTHVVHGESFSGTVAEERWSSISVNLKRAYEKLNSALKARAESLRDTAVNLHPAVGVQATGRLGGVVLRCYCADQPVEMEVSEPVSHNHLCGCSKCWKPQGASFAQIAVAPAGSVREHANASKLECVDADQKIQRYRCKACRTHMVGRVRDRDHHFYGLDFVHPELAANGEQPVIEFAAFVSSLMETGMSPSLTSGIRTRLKEAGIPAYDAFSPELMDIIAWHKVKIQNARQEAAA